MEKSTVKKRLRSLKEWIGLFLWGSLLDKKMAMVRKEAHDKNDELMLLLFGDYLGIPNPLSYYMLELLPYIAEDLPAWLRRMQNRKMLAADKAGQFDFEG